MNYKSSAREELKQTTHRNSENILTNEASIRGHAEDLKDQDDAINHLYGRVGDVENEIDNMQQAALDKSVILSGPIINQFITSSTNDLGDSTRDD